MKPFHISRGGHVLGIFGEQEIREGLAGGRFTPDDYAWREGMSVWVQLGEVPEFQATFTMPPPPGTGAPSFAADPENTQDAERCGLPWEGRRVFSFGTAVLETIKEVLLNPRQAFAQMYLEGGYWRPLGFSILCNVVSGVIGLVTMLAVQSVFSQKPPLPQAASLAAVLGVILMTPVGVFVGTFLGAALGHVCLMLVGGARKPFEATFRVIAYSNGAATVLRIFPVCGPLVLAIYVFFLQVVGFSKVHEISTRRALAAVMLPVVFFCGLGSLALYGVFLKYGPAEIEQFLKSLPWKLQ